MRHELKHIINEGDHLLLKSRLSKLFAHDGNAGAHGEYRVRSLYFDTPGDSALTDKIDGVDRREKFRLRLYDGDASYIRLEKKIKQSGLCAKRSTPLSREMAARILQGDILWMRGGADTLLAELYSKMQGRQLRPKTVVEYIREAFVYPPGNVRVTLDRDIRTCPRCRDFLAPELTLMDTFEAYAVLEVKFDQFLPDIVARAVQISGRRQAAFSKYAICRKYDGWRAAP